MLSGITESSIASASLSNKGDQYFLNMLAIQEWKTKVCFPETFRTLLTFSKFLSCTRQYRIKAQKCWTIYLLFRAVFYFLIVLSCTCVNAKKHFKYCFMYFFIAKTLMFSVLLNIYVFYIALSVSSSTLYNRKKYYFLFFCFYQVLVDQRIFFSFWKYFKSRANTQIIINKLQWIRQSVTAAIM